MVQVPILSTAMRRKIQVAGLPCRDLHSTHTGRAPEGVARGTVDAATS
jgi:hypothetical protein